ncbi:MAG TPA: hypothetical protein VIU15_42095 [Streptomyces sp.]
MRTRLIASCLTAGAALGAVLWPTAATAVQETLPAQVVCVPEARVCAGIAGNATQGFFYEFTIRQPPTPLRLSFTVDGVQRTGNLVVTTQPGLARGRFTPTSALVLGEQVCMTVFSVPGTYCDTVR